MFCFLLFWSHWSFQIASFETKMKITQAPDPQTHPLFQTCKREPTQISDKRAVSDGLPCLLLPLLSLPECAGRASLAYTVNRWMIMANRLRLKSKNSPKMSKRRTDNARSCLTRADLGFVEGGAGGREGALFSPCSCSVTSMGLPSAPPPTPRL